MPDPGIPREKFPWFPTIDYSACISDLHCLNFCAHEVFEWQKETGRPIVAHPYNCVPGCDSCAQECEVQAIRLPSKQEIQEALRRVRAESRNGTQPKDILGMGGRLAPKPAE